MSQSHSTSLVYVVSEPLRWDSVTGQWVKSKNLSPARRFGELVYLLPPGNEAPDDPAQVIKTLREKLRDFSPSDYLLPVGHPLYIAWATAVASQVCPFVTLLHWKPEERAYHAVPADLRTPYFVKT